MKLAEPELIRSECNGERGKKMSLEEPTFEFKLEEVRNIRHGSPLASFIVPNKRNGSRSIQ